MSKETMNVKYSTACLKIEISMQKYLVDFLVESLEIIDDYIDSHNVPPEKFQDKSYILSHIISHFCLELQDISGEENRRLLPDFWDDYQD